MKEMLKKWRMRFEKALESFEQWLDSEDPVRDLGEPKIEFRKTQFGGSTHLVTTHTWFNEPGKARAIWVTVRKAEGDDEQKTPEASM